MKRHRRRETRTDVGRAGLVLTALLFPQVGLKRNRLQRDGTSVWIGTVIILRHGPSEPFQAVFTPSKLLDVSVSFPPPVSKITRLLEDRSLNDLLHLEHQQLDQFLITGHEDFVCCISEGALLQLPGCVCVCVNGFERLN